MSLGLAGVNLRINPKGKWFPGKYVSLESKVFLKGNHSISRTGPWLCAEDRNPVTYSR